MRFGDRDDARQFGFDLRLGSFDLDDQQCADVERIAGMSESLADLDRRLVHEFDRNGNDAGTDDCGDAGARVFACRKPEEDGTRVFRGAAGFAASPR